MKNDNKESTELERLQTDLHRVEKGTKFSQQHLPHVVAAARVGQHQHWSPATAAGRRQLRKHEQHNISVT